MYLCTYLFGVIHAHRSAPVEERNSHVYRSRVNLKADWRSPTRERKVSCTVRCTRDDDVSGPSLVFLANVVPSPLVSSSDCISLFHRALLIPSLECSRFFFWYTSLVSWLFFSLPLPRWISVFIRRHPLDVSFFLPT